MRYAIIGTGAIGGFYGGRLARAGHDVHFLLHTDYEYVRANGLSIRSCDGSFTIARPHAYASAGQMPQCDVALVCLKTTANAQLPALLAPLIAPGTLVVLIQNGIGVEADVAEAIPGVQLAAGLAFVCSTKTAPGLITHASGGAITIANYSCRDATLISALQADLASAGISVSVAPYAEARWKKAVWNMPFNGLASVLGLTTDRIIASPSGERLVGALMAEVIGAARACGATAVDYSFAQKMMHMTRRMPPYSPSMKVDLDLGRPMEIQYLYTRPIIEARRHGFAMERTEVIEAQLRAIEESRRQAPAR